MTSLDASPSLRWGQGDAVRARDIQDMVERVLLAGHVAVQGGRRVPGTPPEQRSFFETLGDWLWGVIPQGDQSRIQDAVARNDARLVVVEAHLTEGPGLPWEYLRVPIPGGMASKFLVLIEGCTLIRSVPGAETLEGRRVQVGQRLAILAGSESAPVIREDSVDTSHLASRLHGLWLRRAGQQSCQKLVYPGDGLGQEFAAAYRQIAAGEPDILYIIAHGDDKANLLFPASNGEPQRLDVVKVAHALGAFKAVPRLVVLNCCLLGGASRISSPERGIWEHFARRLFETVRMDWLVASRTSITAQSSLAFTTSFAGALLDGRTLQQALREAQRRLWADGDWSFASFVLYGRAEGGDIRFERQAPKPWMQGRTIATVGLGVALLGLALAWPTLKPDTKPALPTQTPATPIGESGASLSPPENVVPSPVVAPVNEPTADANTYAAPVPNSDPVSQGRPRRSPAKSKDDSLSRCKNLVAALHQMTESCHDRMTYLTPAATEECLASPGITSTVRALQAIDPVLYPECGWNGQVE